MRSGSVLSIHPTELVFPFELKKDIESCMQLTNHTKHPVAFKVKTTNQEKYRVIPTVGSVHPGSTCVVTVKLRAQSEAPVNMKCEDKFLIMTKDINSQMFREESHEAIKEFELSVVYITPNPPSIVPNESNEGSFAMMSILENGSLLSIHPTKLIFPFEVKKDIVSCMQLTNNTDQFVAFKVLTTHPKKYCVNPTIGSVNPDSTCGVTVKLRAQDEAPLNVECEDKFLIKTKDINSQMFRDKSDKAIEEFELSVVYKLPNHPSPVSDEDNEGSSSTSSILESGSDKSSSSSHHDAMSLEDEGAVPILITFSKHEIQAATGNLSDSSKIGRGGYGTVYRGDLRGSKAAIKMLDPNSLQGEKEFFQELDILGQLRHPYLVRLIGACFSLKSLVYEFAPNGSVGDCLKENPRLLTWQVRTRIVYEMSLALNFLHSRKPEPIVHGDLKPANILLDAKLSCKLADFGLCRFIPRGKGTGTDAYLETQPKGTSGYIDPRFLEDGILTTGCDVYSFGITILKLLTGMEVRGIRCKVCEAYNEKTLMTLVDPTAGDWPDYVGYLLAYFGLKCCGKKRERGSSDLMDEIARDLKEKLEEIGH